MSISVWGIDHGEEIGKAWSQKDKDRAVGGAAAVGGAGALTGAALLGRRYGPGIGRLARSAPSNISGMVREDVRAAGGRKAYLQAHKATVGEQVGRGVSSARTNTGAAYRAAEGGVRRGASATANAGRRAYKEAGRVLRRQPRAGTPIQDRLF
jgi:hypothetical protein